MSETKAKVATVLKLVVSEEKYRKLLNDRDRLRRERDEAVEMVRDLTEALKGVQRGDCWCGRGIGDPRITGHTSTCENAGRALADAREMLDE